MKRIHFPTTLATLNGVALIYIIAIAPVAKPSFNTPLQIASESLDRLNRLQEDGLQIDSNTAETIQLQTTLLRSQLKSLASIENQENRNEIPLLLLGVGNLAAWILMIFRYKKKLKAIHP